MLIDSSLRFCTNTAVAGSAGTAKLGAAFDLGATANQGVGEPLWLVAQIGNVALAGGTSIVVQLVTADNEALTTNPVVLVASATVLTAAGLIGTSLLVVQLPSATYKQWLGLRLVEVGTFSAGNFNAFLTQEPGIWRAYEEANS